MRGAVGLLVVAILGSLALQAAFPDRAWTQRAQMALVWGVLAGLALIIVSRVPSDQRTRLGLILGPGLLLLGLGVVVPDWALFFAGGGLGWMVAAPMLLRGGVQMEYQAAIRHLRRSEYPEALAAMRPLVEAEPENPDHRRFCAELHRLSGNLDQALGEYEQVIRLAPESSMGYIGLAEVYAQQGRYDLSLPQARQANERAPGEWLTTYTLGLVLDRLKLAEEAVRVLEQALVTGVPHSRYRLMTHLWLARNYARTGDADSARVHVRALRQEARGLKEWQIVFGSEQAAPLRRMMEADVMLAQRLFEEVPEGNDLLNDLETR